MRVCVCACEGAGRGPLLVERFGGGLEDQLDVPLEQVCAALKADRTPTHAYTCMRELTGPHVALLLRGCGIVDGRRK